MTFAAQNGKAIICRTFFRETLCASSFFLNFAEKQTDNVYLKWEKSLLSVLAA